MSVANFALCRPLEHIQKANVVAPGNLCNKLLHDFLLRPSVGKGLPYLDDNQP
jgi:hypothetical protein